MKKYLFTIISVLVLHQYNFCQSNSEFNNNTNNDILAAWDIQLSANIPNASGAEFDGLYFYVTEAFSSLINKYDTFGSLIESFSIPGVTGLGDLAFDGTYMYGGSGGMIIFQMDFNTHTLVSMIPSPVNVRHIAYDEINDGFWVGSWTGPLSLVSRTGILIASYIIDASIAGTAYDNYNSGGPFLWIFDRGATPPGPQLIRQFSLSTGTYTGISHDVLSDVGATQPDAVASGLFSTSDFFPGTFSIGGVLIGSPSILFVYDVTNPVPVELTYFTAVINNNNITLNVYDNNSSS